ncbi:MAG: transporter substrate-binding domain-containing protein [Bifidobacteriaceae bacterium]|jgi:polar amino acid transport system substrate-binding protein|nr:transporter substrate-binding domain-containing protein [Bifidobacteriaceae bacterium]
MEKRRILPSLGITAAALALTLTACGTVERNSGDDPKKSDSPDTSIETIKDGTLTVCTNPPYAPFEEVVGAEVVGFDMDLMAEVAADLDLEISFVETPFEAIESAAALDSGLCDVGASALTINATRLAKLDFSSPYYESTLGMLVAADSGIESVADLQGKAVGVQQGTTGEEWAHQQSELTEIKQFEGLGDQVTALKAGEVEAVFNDVPTLTPYTTEGLKVIGDLNTGEKFGFAVKKDNRDLLRAINKTLERVTTDGTYETLIEKWF